MMAKGVEFSSIPAMPGLKPFGCTWKRVLKSTYALLHKNPGSIPKNAIFARFPGRKEVTATNTPIERPIQPR